MVCTRTVLETSNSKTFHNSLTDFPNQSKELKKFTSISSQAAIIAVDVLTQTQVIITEIVCAEYSHK